VLGIHWLIALGVRVTLRAWLHTLGLAGWNLLVLVPYRGLYSCSYAVGWHRLLAPTIPPGLPARLRLWVTSGARPLTAASGGQCRGRPGVRYCAGGAGTVPVAATVIRRNPVT